MDEMEVNRTTPSYTNGEAEKSKDGKTTKASIDQRRPTVVMKLYVLYLWVDQVIHNFVVL